MKKSNKRLNDVKPASLGMGRGIKKSKTAFPPVGNVEDREIKQRQRTDKGIGQILRFQAGDKQNANRNRCAGNSRAQVRLKDNQADKDQRRQHSRKQGVAPVVHRLRAVLKKKGKKKNQHWFGQLGRLKGKSAEVDPAVRVVGAVEEEH